ncbi:hypothetical protein BS35_004917 [Actinomadura glauciflava]|nr:hypothetical protein [Actinomadura glauciflava]
MTGVKDCATEGVECLVDRHAVVMGEKSICMLAREKAFESKEESVEAGGGCVDGVQHCIDGRRPGKATRLPTARFSDRTALSSSRADCSVS